MSALLRLVNGTLHWRIDPVKFFKSCLPHIVLGPFLNILSHIEQGRFCQCLYFPSCYYHTVCWCSTSVNTKSDDSDHRQQTMTSDKFGSQLDRKIKIWFFTFLNVYVSWVERDKILISQLSPPKFWYFADQNGSKGDSMQMNFDDLQIQKWISQRDRAQKVDKKWGHLSSFLFYSLSYGPKWCMFCKFVPISARNLNLLKQFIYIHLKDLMRLFQEMVCFIEVWATVHEILKNKIAKKCWLSRN